MNHQKVSDFLLGELDRRRRRNQSYSLRAFARDLELSVSHLSEVISGERGLSGKSAAKIADKLKLRPAEQSYWFDLVLVETARNIQTRELAKERLKSTRNLQSLKKIKTEQFQVISEWYHLALLELINLKDFQPRIDWIAEKLSITEKQADAAITRLQSVGLLKVKGDKWEGNDSIAEIFSEVPSRAIRSFHKKIIENSIYALQHGSMEDREIQSMLVAIPKNHVTEFRNDMKKFLVDFWEKIKDEPKDSVYALSIQLCPVTKGKSYE